MNTHSRTTFHKRRQVRNFMYSPLVLILLALVVLLFARSVWQAYAKERAARIGEYNAESELAELAERKAKMEKELRTLETAQGIEAKLRTKYGVGLPGEEMIIITEPSEAKNP